MPELPEVETARRGIEPCLKGRRVMDIVVRQRRLRWPVPRALQKELTGQTVISVTRRAKYLLINTAAGSAILHLGMSGSLRIVPTASEHGPHDHVELALDSGSSLRLTDPRRFGALLWTRTSPEQHPLLRDLGPEPLGDAFSGDYLHRRSRGRRLAVKNFLMDSRTVAGVGNIYANEALFMAGIHPARQAGRISAQRFETLANSVRGVLQQAIQQGGTTLRDFVNSEGRPGYFQQTLQVYGRGGQPCPVCLTPLRLIQLGRRSTFYCPRCQR